MATALADRGEFHADHDDFLSDREADGRCLGAAHSSDLGGLRMAIRMAELAPAGLTPGWMPGAVPRCVPVDTRRNRCGDRAVSVVVGTEQALIGGRWGSVKVRACPVTFGPDLHQIDAAQRDNDT